MCDNPTRILPGGAQALRSPPRGEYFLAGKSASFRNSYDDDPFHRNLWTTAYIQVAISE